VGLAEVLTRFPVGIVYDTGCPLPESRSPGYLGFLHAIRIEGVAEERPVLGDVLIVGDLRFEVVAPDRCWHGTNSDPNNDSLVLRLTYGRSTVLFANEPEAEAQEAMLEDGVPLTADVLNVPHHGAATSTAAFFEAVHERVAIVSVGPNDYGHPVPQTLATLRATGARVFRTDRSGDVTILFSIEGGLRVETGRGRTVLFPDPSIASGG
jgi:competence protein ComEC